MMLDCWCTTYLDRGPVKTPPDLGTRGEVQPHCTKVDRMLWDVDKELDAAMTRTIHGKLQRCHEDAA